jgi:hypothetical protein
VKFGVETINRRLRKTILDYSDDGMIQFVSLVSLNWIYYVSKKGKLKKTDINTNILKCIP